ncbi:hypothetical protein BDA96_03G300800 [Sorghum bicolor]|uniref:Uncharacterized protein n=1 Tax=Sorghum bicolor TaxID=4558 RepID=A0A921UPB4_SORBI|nr:hypothetical protein BDA96_03G300800 [Sorghum bicolor]
MPWQSSSGSIILPARFFFSAAFNFRDYWESEGGNKGRGKNGNASRSSFC